MTDTPRTEPPSPDEIRADLEQVRTELGATVEELAHRADIPARARERKDETVRQVTDRITQARAVVEEKAPAVRNAAREKPALPIAIGLAVLLLVVRSVRRRRRDDT